jgi:hypothetical protein
MIAPSDEELLRVWEENLRSHPVRRALLALVAAAPERGWEGWARAPIGERDRALLELYERLFGSELRTTAACPQCGERLESEFSANEIRSASGPAEPSLHLHDRGFDIEYRLPTSEDLLHIAAERSERTSDVEVLLRRCVSYVRQGETALDASSLPDDVIERITDGMAKHDPDADVRIALECPVCMHAWDLQFDIVSYFWSELDDWAQHTLSDVHALASAYGWTERTILALSPMRRRIYLDMVGA